MIAKSKAGAARNLMRLISKTSGFAGEYYL